MSATRLGGMAASPYDAVDMSSPSRSRLRTPQHSLPVAPTSRSPFEGIPNDVVDAALERVLTSTTFRRSERHRAFLRHVVSATRDGRQAELKEVVIGLEVFGRRIAAYDPRQDPIVRVEAGRVRDKLARYYAAEGATDPFELQIPIGGYLPQVFSRRDAPHVARSLGSIAVLPFSSFSNDADDALFCSAMVNQLIDVLGRVPGLRVIGRVSAAKAHAQSTGYPALGKLLGATSVIEGSVQRSGTRYRCIVQKFRTRDGLCEWSERFTGVFDDRVDHFVLQDEISDAVRVVVARHDTGKPSRATVLAPTSLGIASEARDLFARGRYLSQRHEIDGYGKAIPLFERAVSLAPDFAAAYSHLATCQAGLAIMLTSPVKTTFDAIARNANRALVLDPQDGDALSMLGNIAFRFDHDLPRAEGLFSQALRVAPNSSLAHSRFGGTLVYTGRFVEGLQHSRIALDLDPLNLRMRFDYAIVCSYARDYETAIREYEMILALEPKHLFAHIMIGMTYLWRGDPAAARAYLEHAAAIAPEHPMPGLDIAMCLGATGAVDEGRRYLAAHLARIGDAPYARYNRAQAEAFLGDRAAAMTWLHQAAAANEVVLNVLPVDPTFDDYRDDPAFKALLENHGLKPAPPSPYLVTS